MCNVMPAGISLSNMYNFKFKIICTGKNHGKILRTKLHFSRNFLNWIFFFHFVNKNSYFEKNKELKIVPCNIFQCVPRPAQNLAQVIT